MSSPSRATPSCGCGNMEACYYLLTFDRSQSALSAERVLRPRVPVQVMPTLRQLSVSCGISLRVEREHYPALAAALRMPFCPRKSIGFTMWITRKSKR